MNILPTQVDLKFAAPAAAIALEAGSLVRGFYESGVATEYKGEADLVTEADRASERLIVERLNARFPGHGVFGEEGSRGQMESEYRWYIDPIDGTTNFAHRYPVFCVSLGLEQRRADLPADQDGEIVAAVIYDPTRNELFVAEKGKGAYLNGRRIQVSRTATLARACWRPDFLPGSATRIRIYISIRRSVCVRTAFDERVRPHSILPIPPAGVSMDFGNST